MTLTASSLVQGFLNWETEARMGRQRTELGGVQGSEPGTLMPPVGRLAFAAHWSGAQVLCPAVTSLAVYWWFYQSGGTWVRLWGSYDVV